MWKVIWVLWELGDGYGRIEAYSCGGLIFLYYPLKTPVHAIHCFYMLLRRQGDVIISTYPQTVKYNYESNLYYYQSEIIR